MITDLSPADNHEQTKKLVGFVPRKQATSDTYLALGFKSGLEIHQQLKTKKKLFCRCPAGIYQKEGAYDAEVVRHMRPTLSEMGEYDGTALMERKTRKNIVYRLKNETACTYDIDDTPPFPLNREALESSIRIALMLKLSIVGELHITRKQYLDGSIPTGFQRTGIIGIEGEIPLKDRRIGIIQMSIEEDSCREVSDTGHWRVYTTDRLGIPLIEMVTYPDMKTPNEVAEVAHYLRFLSRSSGKVRTGIGAARQDVNVSISGGTRVEIKGVAHIAWIPDLVHTEAFRQKALLEISKILKERIEDPTLWKLSHTDLNLQNLTTDYEPLGQAQKENHRLTAINLPKFRNVLSFFTQPGQSFADELSGRLKVIACLEKPNMLHSEQITPTHSDLWESKARQRLGASEEDALVLVWGPAVDIETAIETIEERCRMAFDGVQNETRKSFADGTTVFERILPGPDRMYPDTDTAPIHIEQELIDRCGRNLPPSIQSRLVSMEKWQIPRDTFHYILKNKLFELIERITTDFDFDPKYVGTLLGHTLRHIERKASLSRRFEHQLVHDLFSFVSERKLKRDILPDLLAALYKDSKLSIGDALTVIDYKLCTREEITDMIPILHDRFDKIKTSPDPTARVRWIMGSLRKKALGNISLAELRSNVEEVVAHV
jgi:glutamyl-tRNA(Gln) amidotransferase subunit E